MAFDAASWVEENLAAIARRPPRGYKPPTLPLTEFQRSAVQLLQEGMNTGIYNVLVNWEKVDWNAGGGVSFTLRCHSLATWDFSQLTRLVIGAHDRCIRLDIQPCAPRYLRIWMHPRRREGAMSQRHPTIEQAIASFRGEPKEEAA